MNAATTINAPYLRTTHTWQCSNGHETVVRDGGWPQRPAVRQAVLKAWAAYGNPDEMKCPTCGGKAHYRASAELATAPAPPAPPAPPAHTCPQPPDFTIFGKEFLAIPRYHGGFAEERARAFKRRGKK